MTRFVAVAFKAVAYAVIFVVIWSVVFYLYRAYALNQKMESVMVTLEQEVAKHNYLTESSYEMYEEILGNIQHDMNGGDNEFIQGFRINYSHPCDTQGIPDESSNGKVRYQKQLNTPANYGDIAVVELSVTINALDLFYDPNANGAANDIQINDDGIATTFTYLSQVPCLRYVSVTE